MGIYVGKFLRDQSSTPLADHRSQKSLSALMWQVYHILGAEARKKRGAPTAGRGAEANEGVMMEAPENATM
jgi:hypothetical protein